MNKKNNFTLSWNILSAKRLECLQELFIRLLNFRPPKRSVSQTMQHRYMVFQTHTLAVMMMILSFCGLNAQVPKSSYRLDVPECFENATFQNQAGFHQFAINPGTIPPPGPNASAWQPDSILEYHTDGFNAEQIRRIYHSDGNAGNDSIVSYYYDLLGRQKLKIGYHTFNAEHKLTLDLIQTEDYYGPDSMLIDWERKEYSWENNMLVAETRRSEDYSWDSSKDVYYIYDQKGKLIRDTLYLHEDLVAIREYEYSGGDTLKHRIEINDTRAWVTAFFYEWSDTSLFTTVCTSPDYPYPEIDPDTLSVWYSLDYYHEVFDESGRITDFSYAYEIPGYPGPYSWKPNYRSEFEFNENGQLTGIYYFFQDTSVESGYREFIRRLYDYDANGNLILFEQMFYDERVRIWTTELRREYYYSLFTALPLQPKAKTAGLHIFPNPASDRIKLDIETGAAIQYTINTIGGIVVESGHLRLPELTVTNLPPGLYILKITYPEGKISAAKFVKD